MATAEQPLAVLPHALPAVSTELADQWRRLTRAATAVFLLTSPALALYFHEARPPADSSGSWREAAPEAGSAGREARPARGRC